MKHDEYIKRRDEILRTIEADSFEHVVYAEAQQAIDQLVLDVVGEDAAAPKKIGDLQDAAKEIGTTYENASKQAQRQIVRGDE